MIQFVLNRLVLFFQFLAFGDVPMDYSQYRPAIDRMARYCCFRRELLTVLPLAPNFTLMPHEPISGAVSQRKAPHLTSVLRAVTFWKQHFHVLPHHLGRAVAERLLRSPVEEHNVSVFVSADYRIGDESKNIDAHLKPTAR